MRRRPDAAERASSSPSLARLQRWFQEEIVAPHEGRRREKGAPRPLDLVLPSRTLGPAERVAIYSRMYFARLLECLRAEFPAVLRLVGDDAFERLARAYLTRHPSRHWSLNVLGRKLPDFLGEGSLRLPRRAMVRDVAALECAQSEVFDEEESSKVLSTDEFVSFPADDWARARLKPIAAFRLLSLGFPANAIVTAARQEKRLPPLGRKPTWVAVYRKDHVVWRMDIDRERHACLDALGRGRTIGHAIAAAFSAYRGPASELEGRVFSWFRDWVAEGFFSGIRAPGARLRSRRRRTRRAGSSRAPGARGAASP